jgi:hypothetical protein
MRSLSYYQESSDLGVLYPKKAKCVRVGLIGSLWEHNANTFYKLTASGFIKFADLTQQWS